MLNITYKDFKDQLTFSTMLTLMRMLLTPFVVIAILTQAWNTALCLFVCAAVTDLLDGAFARLFDEQTALGAALDPVADKFLMLSCYAALLFGKIPTAFISTKLVMLVLIKELLLIAGGVFAFKIQRGNFTVQPSVFGKAAMLIQTVFVFWLLLLLFADRLQLHSALVSIKVLHQLIVIAVVASFIHYVYKLFKETRVWYILKRSFCYLFS